MVGLPNENIKIKDNKIIANGFMQIRNLILLNIKMLENCLIQIIN